MLRSQKHSRAPMRNLIFEFFITFTNFVRILNCMKLRHQWNMILQTFDHISSRSYIEIFRQFFPSIAHLAIWVLATFSLLHHCSNFSSRINHKNLIWKVTSSNTLYFIEESFNANKNRMVAKNLRSIYSFSTEFYQF